MTQSKADGSPGQYFAHALRSACGNCGRSMDKAHRIHHGVKYCSNCYPAVFPPRTCQICGETARAHKHATSSVCGKDRKSTRLNSSHLVISYAVFCLKKKIVVRVIVIHTLAVADHSVSREDRLT